jgi:ribose transport system substrate-binding protein
MRNQSNIASMTLVAVAAAALGFAACGQDDSSDSAAAPGGESSAASAKLDKLYEGTFKRPPTSGPKPATGKTVWLLSCGQALISCSAPIASAEQAASKLGWHTRVFDGKFDPTQYVAGIRQALAAGADGIVTFAIDCQLAKQPLAEAKQAQVPTIGMESIDCASPHYSSIVDYVEGDYGTWETQWGATKATYLAAKSGGKAKVIDFYDDETQASALIDDGFLGEIKKCAACEVVDRVQFTAADVGPKLQQKAEQALLQHPEADAVQIPFDAATLSGIGAAIQASGRGDQLLIVGGEGYPPAVDLVRGGKQQDAGSGSAGGWEGYAAIDSLNRLFSGERPAPSGIGLQLFDKTHNVPASGGWDPPVDYRADYAKAWGTSP